MGKPPGREVTARRRGGSKWPGDPASILLVTRDDWLCRSIGALLNGERYEVNVRQRARSLLHLLSDRRTDVVLLDLRIQGESGRDVDMWRWELPRDPTIPLVAICGRERSAEGRLDALRGGVWDVLQFPLPPAELLAKLETWVRLKRRFDELRSGVLLDVETGHYSTGGVKRRLRELSALARRSGEPLSCVLFGADPMPEGMSVTSRELEEAGRHFSVGLHHQTRNSDVVGRLEPLKFVVLAPQTAPAGAYKLAERVTSWAVSRRLEGASPVTLSAGVTGVETWNGQIEARPELLLASAHRALNEARAAGAAQVATA